MTCRRACLPAGLPAGVPACLPPAGFSPTNSSSAAASSTAAMGSGMAEEWCSEIFQSPLIRRYTKE